MYKEIGSSLSRFIFLKYPMKIKLCLNEFGQFRLSTFSLRNISVKLFYICASRSGGDVV